VQSPSEEKASICRIPNSSFVEFRIRHLSNSEFVICRNPNSSFHLSNSEFFISRVRERGGGGTMTLLIYLLTLSAAMFFYLTLSINGTVQCKVHTSCPSYFIFKQSKWYLMINIDKQSKIFIFVFFGKFTKLKFWLLVSLSQPFSENIGKIFIYFPSSAMKP
jgi:hypothetical protein